MVDTRRPHIPWMDGYVVIVVLIVHCIYGWQIKIRKWWTKEMLANKSSMKQYVAWWIG
jgi:hypothetical protein